MNKPYRVQYQVWETTMWNTIRAGSKEQAEAIARNKAMRWSRYGWSVLRVEEVQQRSA